MELIGLSRKPSQLSARFPCGSRQEWFGNAENVSAQLFLLEKMVESVPLAPDHDENEPKVAVRRKRGFPAGCVNYWFLGVNPIAETGLSKPVFLPASRGRLVAIQCTSIENVARW
jgi:hypothetical protein